MQSGDVQKQIRQLIGETLFSDSPVPLAYALLCELPTAVDGLEGDDRERMWVDRFECEGHEWRIILNGTKQAYPLLKIKVVLIPGTAVVICDRRVVFRITPATITAYQDPHTGVPMAADSPEARHWQWKFIQAVYERLVDHGEELPALNELVDTEDGYGAGGYGEGGYGGVDDSEDCDGEAEDAVGYGEAGYGEDGYGGVEK